MVEIVDYPQRFAPEGSDPKELLTKARDRVRERFLIVENAIAGPWLLPSGFSAADIYVAMFIRWSIGKDWRAKNLPKVSALADAVSQRPRTAPVWAKHFGG